MAHNRLLPLWVLSLSHALSYRLTYDSRANDRCLQVYIRALFGFYRRRARGYGHRTEGARLRHLCAAFWAFGESSSSFPLSCYRIYAPRQDETPEFFSLRPPENSEVAALAGVLAEHQTCRPCSTIPTCVRIVFIDVNLAANYTDDAELI